MPNRLKRARLDDEPCSELLLGDDTAIPPADAAEWRAEVSRCVQSRALWTDASFPPTQISIRGKDDTERASGPPRAVPTCRCGAPAACSTVQKETANKGRQYYHCRARMCGFFSWADGGAATFGRGGRAASLSWARMPLSLHVVSDFGFRAADLRQGGVGDCWFMSALAVVAERHDLIEKLFAADTARNAAGVYCLRLFLDGAWASVWVDDLFPVTSAPRREALAFDTKLAFCRCGSATGEQQLWASLVEKVYAKAHGSYQSISGGWVAEALLDLTGAPTEMIYLGEQSFDSELMWARLRAYRKLSLPMGCGTNDAEGHANLQEVGLVGGHAYSILDVREARTRGGGHVRLLRVRNPHACGEWNGEWSDQSEKWAEVVHDEASCSTASPQAGGFERTGVDDGTFWIDYTKFLMGFSHVDVCYAFRGWHARSFANFFPADRKTAVRVCASVLLVRPAAPATLMVMALQPTRRGAWCRADRKKSYRLGDLSVLIVRLAADGEAAEEVVGGGWRGADRGERTWVARLERPAATYAILPLCLCNNPTAAESTQARQPFQLRLWSSEPLHTRRISSFPPHEASSNRSIEWCASLAHQALHAALLSSPRASPAAPQAFGRTAELEAQLLLPQNASLLMSSAAARVTRHCEQLSPTSASLVVRGEDVTLVCAYNWGPPGSAPLSLRVTVYAKSHAARGQEGLLANRKEDADEYYRRHAAEEERRHAAAVARGRPPPPPRGAAGFRWPAKWSCFRTISSIPPQSRRLVLVAASSGVQAEMGEILVEPSASEPPPPAAAAAAASCGAMAHMMARWLGSEPSSAARPAAEEGLFAAAPWSAAEWREVKDGLVGAAVRQPAARVPPPAADDEAQLQAALDRSAREEAWAARDDALAAAIAASLAEAHAPAATCGEADDELQYAIALSLQQARRERRGGSDDEAAEKRAMAEAHAPAATCGEADDELQYAIALSLQQARREREGGKGGAADERSVWWAQDDEAAEKRALDAAVAASLCDRLAPAGDKLESRPAAVVQVIDLT
ncbi:hypothetical protein AB1Y20_008951 [Prymnesium parvum]|uniref:Calpain catalytic domain-containing protein n=1 Tax=Prymnesium parvum TaxID=97485 RepID=A0AB34JYZ4_PRYPA